jgi:hypothetical protein
MFRLNLLALLKQLLHVLNHLACALALSRRRSAILGGVGC